MEEERKEREVKGRRSESQVTPWTKRLIVIGMLGITITALALDFTGGKELALLTLGSFASLLKGQE